LKLLLQKSDIKVADFEVFAPHDKFLCAEDAVELGFADKIILN
jgi:ATP-dependent protease ClpP protease subunit